MRWRTTTMAPKSRTNSYNHLTASFDSSVWINDATVNLRIRTAGQLIAYLGVKSVLDVGCRNCEAENVIPKGVEYFGNDLFQNAAGSVAHVGDALTLEFGRTFDCVIALDVVEHVDDPHGLMDKLASLAERYLLVSLPN